MTRRIVKSLPAPEKSLITRIRKRARRSNGLVTGIGDDCAVLRVPPGHQLLVTTDFTLENVHFRREWHPPEVVGRRCLTRGLSDIAAMGGEPRAAFLSLALERDTPQKWVDLFLAGLLEAADEFRIPLAGGDTAQSNGGILADIVLVGSVPKGKAVLRSGAQPGDLIYVTGELGGSAAALKHLTASGKISFPSGSGRGHDFSRAANGAKMPPSSASEVAKTADIRAGDYERHFHPTARVQIGQWLRQRGLASAMIDISDGLSTDLEHICEESRVGAVVEAAAIPRAHVGRAPEPVSLELGLHGGEDYELLFTSAKKVPAKIAGIRVTQIGHVTRKSGMVLVEASGRRRRLAARGWEHFKQH
jgi:thiamine-monophosphate kinase